MEPTFRPGSHVLVSRLAYVLVDPEVDELVVVKHPKDSTPMIKRIKEISGKDYFVVGDNLEQSTDSRHFGPIKKEHIVGRVIEI